MNDARSHLQIIRDILRMGTSGAGSIRQQLGLAPEEFNRHCSYLLKACLAKVVTDNGRAGLLQPTPSGEALLELVDKLEALDAADLGEGKTQSGEEYNIRLASLAKLATARRLRERLLQAYVLEQAELARLETQLSGGGDDEGRLELKQRQQRLSMLQSLLDTLQRLPGGLRG